MNLKHFTPLIILFLLGACRQLETRQVISQNQTPQETKKSLAESIIDSFTRWQHFEQITYRDTGDQYAVFVDNVNGNAILCAQYLEQLTVYHKESEGWKIDSTYAWSGYPLNIEKTDVDGMGPVDIRITNAAQINGNSEVFLVLSDFNGRLHYNPAWTHWNSRYDFKSGKLYAFFTGGNNANGKDVFEWHGDTLQLLESVEWNFQGHGAPPTMERSIMRGGQKIQVRTPKGFSDDYIDTALFTIKSLP